ncbi:Erythroid differentiation-related factor 1 [Zootermopsis nevadensis]|uniref:Erythroid differentiation-related factor 1 n=2 Tax=Zootermopsis nevadensis TaxID=136037 RepID=A0A067QH57_ZOONE|nr:Erythroid differentiation-related factor 1 [Zootermopsis nevadensis]
MRALKYCDLDTPGPRQPVYQFRAATIHHRLASLYHKSYRTLTADDARRKNVLLLSRLHYEKSSHLMLQLEHPLDFLRIQLERVVALCSMVDVQHAHHLTPRFTGLNPGKVDGFLRVIKVRSTTPFRGKVKLAVPCRRFTAEPYKHERDVL